jgi:hypothetical protein
VSLASRVDALATRIGQEFATLRGTLGAEHATLSHPTVVQGTGTYEIPIHGGNFTILSVAARLQTPGSTQTVVDVNKNGVTIFGTQANRPTIASGAKLATVGTFSVSSLTDGDYLSVDIDTAGTGALRLVVDIRYRRTS